MISTKPTLLLVESNIWYYGICQSERSESATKLRAEHAAELREQFNVCVVDDVRFLASYLFDHPECKPDVCLVRLPLSWNGWFERWLAEVCVPGFVVCIENIKMLRMHYPDTPIVAHGWRSNVTGWCVAQNAGASYFVDLLSDREKLGNELLSLLINGKEHKDETVWSSVSGQGFEFTCSCQNEDRANRGRRPTRSA